MFTITLPIVKPILKKFRLQIAFLILISVLLGVVPTIQSLLESGVVDVVDNLLENENEQQDLENLLSEEVTIFSESRFDETDLNLRIAFRILRGINLATTFLFYFLIALFGLILSILSKRIIENISQNVFSRLRTAGFQKSLEIDPSNLPSLPNVAGQYAEAIQRGASNITGTYDYMLEAGQQLFSLLTTLYIISAQSLVFVVCCLVLVVGQVIVSIVQARRLESKRKLLDKRLKELTGRTDDILSKREIILAYEQQENYAEKIDLIGRDYASLNRELHVREEVFKGFSKLITDYGRIIILFIALVLALYLDRNAISSIGDAYFLIAVYVRIFVPASNLLNRYDRIRRSESVATTYLEVLDYKKPARILPKLSPAKEMENNGIKFVDVSFRYSPESKLVLKNCNFEIPAQKTTIILGPSGCGKTTIARILLGFWPIENGTITVNGVNINNWSPEALRIKMSYVSQGDHIVDDTVRDNLAWGYSRKGILDQDMLDVLKDVHVLRDGNSKILDVRAKELSTGQKQRLSFARMLLDESEILIIDEPLTGVDIFTMQDILPQLTGVFQHPQKTVIMISHRVAFTAFADNIIIMNHDGSVAEQGNPKDLREKKDSVFGKLYSAAINELAVS